MIYEQTLRDLFSGYDCEVIDVTIKQYKIDNVRCIKNIFLFRI